MTKNMNACYCNNLLLTEHECHTGEYWPDCKIRINHDQERTNQNARISLQTNLPNNNTISLLLSKIS